MDPQSIGELELQVWRFVSDRGGATVAEVAHEFAQRRGSARTTILTVMGRLRSKKLLMRRRSGGSFRYFSKHSKSHLLKSLVARFADQVLGGSLDPFIAYLVRDARLTDAQLRELRTFVDSIDRSRKEGNEK